MCYDEVLKEVTELADYFKTLEKDHRSMVVSTGNDTAEPDYDPLVAAALGLLAASESPVSSTTA